MNLFKKMKKSASESDSEDGADASDEDEREEADDTVDEDIVENSSDEEEITDTATAVRQRAHLWAEKACQLVGLVRRPRNNNQAAQVQYQQSVEREAKKLIFKFSFISNIKRIKNKN